MWIIPLPPRPEFGEAAMMYAAAGGAILVGSVVLLWGRHLHRALLMAIGAGAGFLLAEPLALQLGTGLHLTAAAAMLTSAIVALVLARLIWPLLAVAIYVGIATLMLKGHYGPIPWPDTPTLPDWLLALQAVAIPDASVWQEHLRQTLLVLAPAAIFILVLGLLLGRIMVILMTSLVGALTVTGGIALAVLQRKPELWPADWNALLIPAAIAGGLAALGLIGQVRGLLGDIARQKKAAEEEQKDETQSARSADKK